MPSTSRFQYFNTHKPVEVETLQGGMTNHSILVRTESKPPGEFAYVGRIPGKGTELYIDRAAEAENIKRLMRTGLTPEVVSEEQHGVRVTRYLRNAVTVTKSHLEAPHHFQQIIQTLKSMHERCEAFTNDIDVFDRNRKFRKILHDCGFPIPDDFLAYDTIIDSIETVMRRLNIPKKPCHHDANVGNILFANGRHYLIDLEYSGNNDPMYDIAYLANSFEFDLNVDRGEDILRAYYGDELNEAIRSRFYLFKLLIDHYSCLWVMVQMATQNLSAESGMEIMRQMMDRLRRDVSDKEFQKAMETLTLTFDDTVKATRVDTTRNII